MDDQYESWEDLGDTIQQIIDSAVRSQDYQKLNQTVTQAVNRAVDTGNEAVRKARAARNQYARWSASGQRANKNIYSSKLGSFSARQPSAPKQENLPALYRNTGGKMAGGILKTVGGGIVTFWSSGSLLAAVVLNSLAVGGSMLSAFSTLGVLGLGLGGYLLTSGIRTIKRMNRFGKYVKVLGRKTYCSIEQLSRMVGKPTKFVRKELNGMIQEGLFLEGHLDHEEKNLITSDETFHHYEQTQLQLAKRQQEQKLIQQQEQKPSIHTPQVQEVLDRGNAFIRQIRACNEAIPGEEISEKIYRMELIIRKIFDRAEAHPEIVPDLKKMMDYYLPMTVKLLNAYAEMDAQPIQGATIQKSKLEIEATLDTLNQAFEKLLDSIFKDTALDVSSDISVLQTLLAQEGLTDDGMLREIRQKQDI